MTFVLRCCLILLPLLAVAAEDRPLRLGLGLEESTDLDGGGLVVRGVEAEASGAALGLQAGDRLLSLNGTPVSSLAQVGEIVQNLRAGAELHATVKRGDQTVELKTTAVEAPRPAQIAERTRTLQANVADLQKQLDQDRSLRLEEILVLLQKIERDLPGMAAEFKRHYPQGRFRVKIDIDIQSDVGEATATPIAPVPEPAVAPRP